MTHEEQRKKADELLFHRHDELEFKIREWAVVAVDDPQTFKGGLRIPYMPEPPKFVSVDPNEMVTYYILEIQLNPGLRYERKAALLIAESILRDQVRKFVRQEGLCLASA